MAMARAWQCMTQCCRNDGLRCRQLCALRCLPWFAVLVLRAEKEERARMDRPLHDSFTPQQMTAADRDIEAVVLRAPWDIAFPYVAGALRALQGPVCHVPDAVERPASSALDFLPLMTNALPSAAEAAQDIPSLEPTLVIGPADAAHLTLLETPAVLGLAQVISAIAPKLAVIEVVSRLPRAGSERHMLTVWRGGTVLRRISATRGALPQDCLIQEGETLPWEAMAGEEAGAPADRFSRSTIFASLRNIGLDLASVLGRRSFARSALLSPLLTAGEGAEATLYTGHMRLTDLAIALGHGQSVDGSVLDRDRQRDGQFRAQVQGILRDFGARIADMQSPDAIAAAAIAVSRELALLGQRAEPAVMQAAGVALSRASAVDDGHAATVLLRKMHDEASRRAFGG